MRPMLLAVIAAVSLPAIASAQQPKPDSYLLQVAAAVAGYSAGGPVYVVICETGGEYKVIGAYATAAQANDVANAKRSNRTTCYVEGPYTSTITYGSNDMQSMRYGAGCKKGPDSDCIADSTSAVFMTALGNIESVTITYRTRDGRPPVSETFDPRTVEAIFFTMPAVDRILIPYYFRVYGITGTLQRRRLLLGRFGARDLN